MYKMQKNILVAMAGIFLLCAFSSAPTPYLVQSIPVQTGLEHHTLPYSKDVWIQMIQGAKSNIDLGQFYVSSAASQSLEPVIEELEKAAKRGVKIRLLVSAAMIDQDKKTLERFRAMKDATVRIIDLSKLTEGILHAKYWIIDKQEIYVGSQNFDWRALDQIHELGVRIQDSELSEKLLNIFEIDWKIAETGAKPPSPAPAPPAAPNNAPIELVASPAEFNPPGIRPAITALLELLKDAKISIRIQLLSYSLTGSKNTVWPEIDNALRAAGARGVRIELLVSHWNTEAPAINHLKSLSKVPNVEVRIATIPQLESGYIPYARVIHSKYMVIDNQIMWLGTSNWSKGYFYASRNVELIFRNPSLATTGVEIFDKLWTSRYAEKVDPLRDYPPPRK